MADASAEVSDVKKGKRPTGAKKPPEPVERVNPRWARSAQPAAAPGKSASRLASGATGLDGRKLGRPKKKKKAKRTRRPWGQHTWAKRWYLEQRRSKEIAMLVPGMMLHREYKGVIHRVRVRERDYLYVTQGKVYPTLNAVTTAITGKTKCRNGRWLAPISAIRFWNLRRLFVTRPM
jgi:hypothetical protein